MRYYLVKIDVDDPAVTADFVTARLAVDGSPETAASTTVDSSVLTVVDLTLTRDLERDALNALVRWFPVHQDTSAEESDRRRDVSNAANRLIEGRLSDALWKTE